MSDLERIVEFVPAYDQRAKGRGIHGVELRMVLRGPLGATQFVLYTNWHLPSVSKKGWPESMLEPMPADLGYHAPTPRYEFQTPMECSVLPGGTCYYDGSGLNAERIYDVLRAEGSDGVWRELEAYYRLIFEGGAG